MHKSRAKCFRSSVVSGCAARPAFQPTEHDLNAVAPLISSFVVVDGFLALLAAGDAGAYSLVFQRFSKPVGITPAIFEKPVDVRQATRQRLCSSVITDLPGGYEQVQRASLAVTDCAQLGVHAALSAPNQAPTPPF